MSERGKPDALTDDTRLQLVEVAARPSNEARLSALAGLLGAFHVPGAHEAHARMTAALWPRRK